MAVDTQRQVAAVARSEPEADSDRHRLVRTSCAYSIAATCFLSEHLCLTPSDAAGYRVEQVKVVSRGRCPDCLVTRMRKRTERRGI